MNRTTLLFFGKSIVAFLFILFSNNILAVNYYAVGDGVNFNSPSSWGLTSFTQVAPGDYLVIDFGRTVNINSNINVENLRITGGGRLKVNTTADITIVLTGDLNINDIDGSTMSSIDFGTGNVSFTVTGNLVGGTLSKIIHNPSAIKTQKLILKGASNTLYQYTYPNTGTSIVTYNGTNQTIFNAGTYSYLELINGVKTLLAASPNAGEATVTNALTITNCKFYIGTMNFNYLGSENKLNCTNGWVYTDPNGGGSYSSISSDPTRVFPIGNSSTMLALSISNISGTKVSVRFNTTETAVLPNSGVGAWFITPASQTTSTITFLNAGLITSLSPASNIAMYSAPIWKIQPTTYNATTYSYITSNNTTLPVGTTAFGLFTCPSFTTSPSSLPDALAGSTYNQTVLLSNGTAPYNLISYTSTYPAYNVTAPTGTTDQLKISGTAPTASGQSATISCILQDATGCKNTLSGAINTYVQTTWNGSSWSGVTPDGTTPNVRAIIAGNYSTAQYGIIKAGDIIIKPNGVLLISIKDTITAADTLKNSGRLIRMCGSDFQAGNLDMTNAPEYLQTTIAPVTMTAGIVGQPYIQTFSVFGDPNPTFTIKNPTVNPLPSGYTFNPTTNTLTFTPSIAGTITFDITYDPTGVCKFTQTQTIKILDLPSPNLTILNIGAKTYGDPKFKIRTYSRNTTTPITYTIVSGSCATISNDSIIINCAGPSPGNVITVKATQFSDGTYKDATATETFVIKPADGHFIVRNNAFILGQSKAIGVYSRLDNAPVLTFDQLTGTNIATVQTDGMVIPLQTGAFSVHISMAATDNYTAFDSTYTFNVITLQLPPVAIADTIVLEMGKDTTFNILYNDLGMTEEISPNKTDIDIENSGVQTKFYSTELGNFLIDPQGNLTVLPFNGFIGNGRLGYSVADVNGLRSDIAYVEVIVTPPYVVPELKVNDIMTPNGDHLNDALVIANTDLSKENSLTIIDQAGNTVYETTNYQNNWEGVDKKNNKLEPGVYFYTFKEKNSGRELKKYIQIVR